MKMKMEDVNAKRTWTLTQILDDLKVQLSQKGIDLSNINSRENVIAARQAFTRLYEKAGLNSHIPKKSIRLLLRKADFILNKNRTLKGWKHLEEYVLSYNFDIEKWFFALNRGVIRIQRKKDSPNRRLQKDDEDILKNIADNQEDREKYNQSPERDKRRKQKKKEKWQGMMMLRLHPSGGYFYFGEDEDIRRELGKRYHSLLRAGNKDALEWLEQDVKFHSQPFYTVPFFSNKHGIAHRTIYDVIEKNKGLASNTRYVPYIKNKRIAVIPQSKEQEVLKICGRKIIFNTWLKGICSKLKCEKSGARKLIDRMVKKSTARRSFFNEELYNDAILEGLYSKYKEKDKRFKKLHVSAE